MRPRAVRQRIPSVNWPTIHHPKYLQQEDVIYRRLADGTRGEEYEVDINDPFKAEVCSLTTLAFDFRTLARAQTVIASLCEVILLEPYTVNLCV